MKKLIAVLFTVLLALATVYRSESERPPKPRVTTNQAVVANNAFAFDLYGRLASDNSGKSLFFSPWSISNALAIAAEGARGQTAAEMGKALRFPQATRRTGAEADDLPWDLGPIHSGLSALNKQFDKANRPPSRAIVKKLDSLRKELTQANEEVRENQDRKAARRAQQLADEINNLQAQIDRYEIRVANALWAEKTHPFKQSYLDTIHKLYETGGAFPVDFIKDSEGARKRINSWVEKQTRDRIKNLIPAKAVDEDTRLVITNAIYFKGQWSDPFKTAQTKTRQFTLADGEKVKTPTMHAFTNAARYAAFEKDGAFFDTPTRVPADETKSARNYPGPGGFEILELPYKGDELSMLVLAPRSPAGIGAMEKMLTANNVKTWSDKLRSREVEVFLPKFKLESSFALKEPLEALGMKTAFTNPNKKGGARFDGLTDTKDPTEKLYIAKVLHKAFVEVNEKGAEAAAATAVLFKEAKIAPPATVPFTPQFKADKPFVFLIIERKTGGILFLGRVMKP
jgi:serine protease inhibitor